MTKQDIIDLIQHSHDHISPDFPPVVEEKEFTLAKDDVPGDFTHRYQIEVKYGTTVILKSTCASNGPVDENAKTEILKRALCDLIIDGVSFGYWKSRRPSQA